MIDGTNGFIVAQNSQTQGRIRCGRTSARTQPSIKCTIVQNEKPVIFSLISLVIVANPSANCTSEKQFSKKTVWEWVCCLQYCYRLNISAKFNSLTYCLNTLLICSFNPRKKKPIPFIRMSIVVFSFPLYPTVHACILSGTAVGARSRCSHSCHVEYRLVENKKLSNKSTHNSKCARMRKQQILAERKKNINGIIHLYIE